MSVLMNLGHQWKHYANTFQHRRRQETTTSSLGSSWLLFAAFANSKALLQIDMWSATPPKLPDMLKACVTEQHETDISHDQTETVGRT